MLTYRRVFCKGNIMRYEFYPEGNKSTPGLVEYVDGEGKIIKHSRDDFKSFYAMHALQIDTATETGTIAWF